MNTILHHASALFSDFTGLLFPGECLCCGQTLFRDETILCFDCVVNIPRTGFHLERNNPVEQLFWGRLNLERATSFFTFRKGSSYQKLMHALKYKGSRETGIEMGRLFAAEISESGFFHDIDMLVPVPLHHRKERQRGYNQSAVIAEGMALITQLPVGSGVLSRRHYTETQTRKGRWERWKNVEDLFVVSQPDAIKYRHLLLIDDVVTTGATLEACGNELLKTEGVRLSVATLAWAAV